MLSRSALSGGYESGISQDGLCLSNDVVIGIYLVSAFYGSANETGSHSAATVSKSKPSHPLVYCCIAWTRRVLTPVLLDANQAC